MLSRRKLEVIAAVLILIVLILLLWWFVFRQPKPEVVVNPQPDNIADLVPSVNPADVPAPGVVSAQTITRIFIERFGSYSSESDFANVDDIMSLATPSYQAELNSLLETYRRQYDAEAGYSGISTRVITIKTVSESDTASTFLVTTQREEAVGTPGNTTLRYQDAEVSLVKVGEDWLVNDLNWK